MLFLYFLRKKKGSIPVLSEAQSPNGHSPFLCAESDADEGWAPGWPPSPRWALPSSGRCCKPSLHSTVHLNQPGQRYCQGQTGQQGRRRGSRRAEKSRNRIEKTSKINQCYWIYSENLWQVPPFIIFPSVLLSWIIFMHKTHQSLLGMQDTLKIIIDWLAQYDATKALFLIYQFYFTLNPIVLILQTSSWTFCMC